MVLALSAVLVPWRLVGTDAASTSESSSLGCDMKITANVLSRTAGSSSLEAVSQSKFNNIPSWVVHKRAMFPMQTVEFGEACC